MEKITSIFKPIVRNVINNELYSYEGENIFKNVRTNKSGKITDETAQKTFVINLEATELLNQYPLIVELIQKLNLKMDK